MNLARHLVVFMALGTLGCLTGCREASQSSNPGNSPTGSAMQASADTSKKRVIILCTGNSCRSQMAEAFWRKYGGDNWEVVSAGVKPSGKVYPLAIKAMAEKGFDISNCKSKSVTPFLDQRFDLVVTVCGHADKTCPTFPGGGKYLHHPFDDPPKAPGTDEERMKVTRRVRDEIEAKVQEWIATESG